MSVTTSLSLQFLWWLCQLDLDKLNNKIWLIWTLTKSLKTMPVNQLPVTLMKLRTMSWRWLLWDIYIKVVYVMYDKLVSAKRSMQVGGERERGPSTEQLVSMLNFVPEPSLTNTEIGLAYLYLHNKQIHCSLFCKLYTVDQLQNNWYPCWALSHYQFWPTPFVFQKKQAFLDVYTQ